MATFEIWCDNNQTA